MMTRQLKFRAWDGFNKKMSFFTMNDLCIWEDSNPEKPSALDEWTQYTGLHDKNGKEIYEGDIIGKWDKALWEVGFNEGRFCFIYNDGRKAFSMSKSVLRNKEIIGNIYENPDLLK